MNSQLAALGPTSHPKRWKPLNALVASLHSVGLNCCVVNAAGFMVNAHQKGVKLSSTSLYEVNKLIKLKALELQEEDPNVNVERLLAKKLPYKG